VPVRVSSSFEGDLIRPLGQVTLYFGYVEAEVNGLLRRLREIDVHVDVSAVAPLGQRLTAFALAIQPFQGPAVAEVTALLEESKVLIDRRNALVHAGIYANGRVVPNDPAKPEYLVTPEILTSLAEQAFNWKERLNAAIQLRLLPALRERVGNGT
jgi:hypothetical protein